MKKLILSFTMFILVSCMASAQLNVTINSEAICSGNSTVLTATVTGGTPPYNYNWSNGSTVNPISVNPTITTNYTCTVTDGVYTNIGYAIVNVVNGIPAQPSAISGPSSPCEGSSATYSVTNIVGVTYTWAIPADWIITLGQGTNTIIVVAGSLSGIIAVTPSNACGNGVPRNLAVVPLTLPAQPGPINVNGGSCFPSFMTVCVTSVPGVTYMWTVPAGWTITAGQGSNCITVNGGTSSGNITVTPTNACGPGPTQTITVSSSYPPYISINNSNPTICPGGISILTLSGATTYIWSNGLGTGNPKVVSPTTTTVYTVTGVDNLGCSSSCTAMVTVIPCQNMIPKAGLIYQDQNDNGTHDPGEPPLANRIVKEMPVGYYFASDSVGRYSAYYSSGSYTLSGNVYQNYCGYNPSSQTLVSMSDTNNDFGYHCWPYNDVSVYFYPSFVRPGFNTSVWISYGNHGSDTAAGQIQFHHDNLLTLTGVSVPYVSYSNGTITWNYSNLAPNQNGYINVVLSVPSYAALGDTVYYQASITPLVNDSVPSNNSFNAFRIVTNAIDPNEKQVSESVITPQQVMNDQELIYTVHFQNTGNDTAFKVVIRDTLSSKLDITSLETIGTSHPYTFSIQPNGTAVWTFNNILLPDSSVDFDGSQGFVTYKLNVKNTLVQGNIIYNKAYIYFDYNLPVPTNTVSTLIDAMVNVPETMANGKLEIVPNPARDHVDIVYCDQNASSLQLRIFDLSGQLVYEGNKETFKGRFSRSLSLAEFSEGIYFIKLTTESASVSKKLIVIK